MAIVTEKISDELVKTYSDSGYRIHGGNPEADYDAAIDPIDSGRTYTETSIPIDGGDDAEIDDYQAALAELGVQ